VKSRLAHLWADHKLLFLSFVLALAVTLFFAIRSVTFLIYWSDPSHRNQSLEAWMTPRYIAHSHDVPLDMVSETLGLAGLPAARPTQKPTLHWIARHKNVPLEALISELDQAIAAHKADQQ